jgi:hypothetical protein
MTILLEILGGALGLAVPGLFVFALNQGIERAPFDAATKARRRKLLVLLTAAWTLAVWASSLAGVIDHHDGDPLPRVWVYVFVPVLVGIVALARSADFRAILDHTPVATLVGVQSFRFAGAAFLLVVALGVLPAPFAGGGYGDILTGLLATVAALALGRAPSAGARAAFWGFTLAGLLDIANVAYLMLAYDPIWYHGTPSSAPLGQFALVMVPAIAVPVALLLHTFAVRGVLLGRGVGAAPHGGGERHAQPPAPVTSR